MSPSSIYGLKGTPTFAYTDSDTPMFLHEIKDTSTISYMDLRIVLHFKYGIKDTPPVFIWTRDQMSIYGHSHVFKDTPTFPYMENHTV